MGLAKKGDLKGSFGAVKAPLMYHAIPVAPEGDEIRLSTKYGAKIKPDILAALGVTDTDHPPLVFASAHMTKALAFGLDTFKSEKILNAGIEGTEAELVLAVNRDVTMNRAREGKVYAFSAEGFVTLPYADRQAVSTQAVKFKDAQVVLEIKSADDLMRAGLQILSFRETAQELWEDKKVEDIVLGRMDIYKGLAELVREGRVVWENHARGIAPNPVLAQRLGIDLPAQDKTAKPRVAQRP